MLCKCKLWLCTGLRRNGRNDNDVADEGIRNHQLIKTVVTCPVNQPRSVSDSVELVVTNVIECWSIARNVILQSVWFLCNFQCIRCQVSMFESRYPGGCCRGRGYREAGFMQIYLLPLTATLRCLIHWPLSRQHYQGKKKKSCGWGAKMCILHPGFWLSVSNIAYWFAASCHTPDWAKLICFCSL